MRTEFVCACVCVLLGVRCVSSILTPVIETESGKVRGLRSVSGQNLFYGIPYASSRRFQLPQKPLPWNGTYYAVRRFGSCTQTVSVLRMGTEDCLKLDLYVPETAKSGDKLPVLVFLHGGAYYYGSKIHYDPEFLVTKNIIAAIINYRVGVLGFLCINGVSNLGLRDQVAALKWIKKNVEAFGGDPDNVTIFGQSAGASAASMHLLSESSQGLFHKLILMSGNPLTPWAFNPEPHTPAVKDARKAKQVATHKEVYNFFANATSNDILTVTQDTSINPRYFKYSPCVDSHFKDPFFKDTPYNIIKSGKFTKVPIIIGTTSVEGLLFYGLNDERTLRELDEDFLERLPSVFSWCTEKNRRDIAKRIRLHYFGSKAIQKKLLKNVIKFYSDWLADGTAGAFSDLMMKVSDKPVYRYLFDYEGDRNFAKMVFGRGVKVDGASHSDDIFYLFKPAGLSLILSNRDRLFIDRLTDMFTNFMKFGDPTPNRTKLLPVRWSPYSEGKKIMELGQKLSLVSPRVQDPFYLNLLCTHGQPGYVPCESQAKCDQG